MTWMTINDFNTASLSGCQLLDIGEVRAAEPRTAEEVTVYGSNGRLRLSDGAFDGYERQLVFVTKAIPDLERVINAFLVGKNRVSFWYQEGSHFFCDYLGAHYEPWGLHRWKLVVKLYMYPFRYQSNPTDVVLTRSGTVTNPGTVFSEPTIIIEGSGEVSLTIGNQTMALTIDTRATIVCRHGEQAVFDKNGQVRNTSRKRGPFYELVPGRSGVTWTGTVRRVTIQGNWRYLI